MRFGGAEGWFALRFQIWISVVWSAPLLVSNLHPVSFKGLCSVPHAPPDGVAHSAPPRTQGGGSGPGP